MNHPIKPILRGMAATASLALATLMPPTAHAQQAASNAAYSVLSDLSSVSAPGYDEPEPVGVTLGSNGYLWSPLNAAAGDGSGDTEFDGSVAQFMFSGAATDYGYPSSLTPGANGPLCLGPDGDLYGASQFDIFKIDPSGNITPVATTPSSSDYWISSFSLGSDGNLYAAASVGYRESKSIVVCKLTTSGALTTFTAPSSLSNNYYNSAPPILGADGNLYGTAPNGGANNDGAIYKLTPSGQFTTLYSFSGSADGELPLASLTPGSDGNFYGVAYSGGANNEGTAFKITPAGDFTLLYSFGKDNSGSYPEIPLILASDGNFYGTTDGFTYSSDGSHNTGGTLFQLTPSGELTTLYTFPYYEDDDYGYIGNSEGSGPDSLLEGPDGVLYGTAEVGGDANDGTLFALTVDGLTDSDAYQLSSVALSPASDRSTATTVCTVTLSPGAPVGGTTVALSSNSSLAPVPSSLSFPAGAHTASFNITPGNVTKTTQTVITATYNGMSQSATLTITPPYLNYVEVNPDSIGGGASTEGYLELSPAAPSGGFVVNLSSSSSLASVPASVTVTAGQKYTQFPIKTSTVSANAQVTITATFNGSVKTSTFTITPAALQSVACAPATTTGGATTGGNRVYFNGNVASDSVVSLSSSDTTIATVPSTVTVKADTSYHSFPITAAKILTTKTVTITATYKGTKKTATLTVNPDPNAAKSVTLSPASIVGGQSSTANRVYLYGDATADTSVTLTSSNTAVAVPKSTTVSSGSSSHVFTIDTSAVTTTQTVTITATADGVSQSATLTVTPPPVAVKSIALSKSSTIAEQSVTGTVTLSNPAPSGGATVSLSSSTSAATVPSSVTVAAGATTATFTVTTSNVSSNTTATITASYSGTSQSASLTITPRTLKSVTLSPTSTEGGTSTTANTVTLYSNATASTVITLTSSDPSVASVPSSVTVSSGSSSQVFTIATKAVTSSETVAITASYGSVSQTAVLTVTP